MKIEQARQIVAHAVEKTKWRWTQYEHSWKDIDTTFLKHGYEQGGFQFFKFSPLLARADILSIGQLGSILEDYPGKPAYDRSFSGGLTSEFYASLRKKKKGETGKKLYSCIDEFTREKVGSPGRFFWRLIWQMLVCCRYLRRKYTSSFRYYLIEKFSEFKRKPVADETLLNTSPEEWKRFKQTKRPWKELTGIGENVFDFIVGDIEEAHFAQNSFKLDSANQHFLQVTEMARLMPHIERENVVQFIRSLKLPYTLRERQIKGFTPTAPHRLCLVPLAYLKAIIALMGARDMIEV